MRFSCQLLLCLVLMLFLGTCNHEQTTLFVLKDEQVAGFLNELSYTEEFNPYTYRNFYNGAGVALGDINNDGLVDIYYTGNIVDNKMYLNKGNWEFEDVTERCGLACPDVWSSGACFADVNGDGLLDLYVCKAGKPGGKNRHNELFINKGNLEFEEQSVAYGLDITGLSIQSAFFDYDRDGDLDCYLLNNSLRPVGGFDLVKDRRLIPSEQGNKFFENQNGKFIDVTEEAGIYSSEIGFGLGITLSDFNLDGWPDIYISNDFYEKDYLYINNGDKTFKEAGEEYFQCFPLGSMGADVADLDNDLRPDLMITEMLPNTIQRKKTKQIYESWKKYSLAVSKGYYHQFPRNMLQRNMGESGFLEVGRRAGVEATNWSWSSLMQDFDNDGLKDIIVANGIYKDLLDRDYLAFDANEAQVKSRIQKGGDDAITQLIDAMPSKAVSNFAFKNLGDFNFENYAESWGLGQESFSNGCAYADLDNDGDLDLIFNNVNMPSFVFENKTDQYQYGFLKINLKGAEANTRAIGAKVIVYACGQTFMNEQYPSRGFQSSVSNQILFGLGMCQSVDSLKVIWPNGQEELIHNISINTTLDLNQNEKQPVTFVRQEDDRIISFDQTLDFIHRQIPFNQFNRERLLTRMNPVEGPALAVGDLNGDQNQDIIIGGAKGQQSGLLMSNAGTYQRFPLETFERSEVSDIQFFDADQDGDLDVYIANGGSAFSSNAVVELKDEIFINQGDGDWLRNTDALPFPKPIATGALAIADYDKDGLNDIFVGGRNGNKPYGVPGSGFLFKNRGNLQFDLIDVPDFKNLGMITDAKWIDINKDQRLDLIVVGEWMPITVFINTTNGFEKQDEILPDTKGLWNTIFVYDFNGDGEDDIFVGNAGTNTGIHENHLLYINDFDKNGGVEQVLAERIGDKIYPAIDMDELMSQLPGLKRKYVYYKDYAEATIDQLFDAGQIEEGVVLSLDVTESQLYFKKDGKFELQSLPEEFQFSSIHAAIAHDFDKDGFVDLLVGGNHYLSKPQFGRDDASKAWIAKGFQNNGSLFFDKAIPLNISGEIRDFEMLNENKLVVGINNEPIKLYSF